MHLFENLGIDLNILPDHSHQEHAGHEHPHSSDPESHLHSDDLELDTHDHGDDLYHHDNDHNTQNSDSKKIGERNRRDASHEPTSHNHQENLQHLSHNEVCMIESKFY